LRGARAWGTVAPSLREVAPIPTASRTDAAAEGDPLAVSAGLFWSLFLVLFVLSALPVLIVDVPPLFDYPNHLARMYLLAHLQDAGRLQAYYAVHWTALPNLAMDLVVPLFARVMPLPWAGKIFILASFALTAGGVASVHRIAAGRWTLWPLTAFLFLYSRILLWGFLNYLFGIGLALVGLAAWMALAERPPWLRLLVGALFALATFFAHLMAALVLGAMVAGYELDRLSRLPAPRWRTALQRLGVTGLAFAVPVLLLLAGPHGELGAIRFSRWVRKFDLPFSVLDDYHRAFDLGCFIVLLAGGGILLARGRLRVMASLRLALFFLLFLYVIAPTQIMTASAVDHRLPLLLAFMLTAATVASGLSVRQARYVAIFLCALFVVRMGLVLQAWEEAAQAYRRDIAVLDRLPEGARVALAYPASAIAVDPVPKTHLPLLAVIRRDAFVPTLFAFKAQQPVLLTPLGETLAAEAEPSALWRALQENGGEDAVATALRSYDFLIALDRRPFRSPPLPELQPVAAEPDFALYRVQH